MALLQTIAERDRKIRESDELTAEQLAAIQHRNLVVAAQHDVLLNIPERTKDFEAQLSDTLVAYRLACNLIAELTAYDEKEVPNNVKLPRLYINTT